ncbi:hypothetical protein COCC4DRAFT_137801, partial [Bipolaris maydis ATCC 48331]
RSTRSIVLGKAKVISFEDLEEARAKRAEKQEKASAANVPKKRERKPKSSAAVQSLAIAVSPLLTAATSFTPT